MRNWILNTLLLLCAASFGQDLSLFNASIKLEWIKLGYATIDERTLEEIFPLIKGKPYPDLVYAKEAINAYHFIDLDKDGRNEILYNGWGGGEGEMVIILKKNKNGYFVKHQFYGRIVKLNDTKDEIDFIILDYACCAGYVDHLTYVTYDSMLKSYAVSSDYAVMNGSIDSLDFIEPVGVVVSREPYNMRFSPQILQRLDPNDYPFDLIQTQNISAIFKKGDQGMAIAQKTDSTGRVWWLVVMDRAPIYPNTLFYQGNNDIENYKPIGWMSSRYLQKE